MNTSTDDDDDNDDDEGSNEDDASSPQETPSPLWRFLRCSSLTLLKPQIELDLWAVVKSKGPTLSLSLQTKSSFLRFSASLWMWFCYAIEGQAWCVCAPRRPLQQHVRSHRATKKSKAKKKNPECKICDTKREVLIMCMTPSFLHFCSSAGEC